MKNKTTDLFDLYQTGIDYKNRISYFDKCDLHWDFYNSKQWARIRKADQPAITINYIKQGIDYKTSAIMSQNVSINYNSDYAVDNMEEVPEEMREMIEQDKAYSELLTKMVKRKYDKDEMPILLREVLLNAGVTGDMALYSYWDSSIDTMQNEKGDVCTIAIDGSNIFFQDANNPDVQKQDWIIISGRDSVKNLKEEAERYKTPKDEIDKIQADTDTEYQVGRNGKIEMDYGNVDGKALYLIKFWKENGTVKWCKKTKFATIRSEVDLGISLYPLAYRNWGKIKNSMHGMSEVEAQVDNQIAINQLNSLFVLWARHNAFGKVAYDKNRIASWSNSVTASIPVDGDITGAVQQIRSGDFNPSIINYSQILLDTVKSTNGMNDAALGQVDPKNTSAIITTIKQSGIPLENIQANVYQLVRDWAMIQGEFITAKYSDRYVSVKEDEGISMVKFTKPSNKYHASVTIDVGPSNYFNESIGMASLDRLLEMQKITDVEYFERMKKFNIIPDVDGLIEARTEPETVSEGGGIEELIAQLPPEVQQQFMGLPQQEQQRLLQEFQMQSQQMV